MYIMFKELIYAFLPPLINPLYKDRHMIRRTYNNYNEALKVCNPDGYENSEVVKIVKFKTELYLKKLTDGAIPELNVQIMSLLTIITHISLQKKKNRIKVLDFGGACGLHFFEVNHFLKNSIELEWHVVETSEMVKASDMFSSNNLYFHNSIENAVEIAGSFDIVHSSGTLQAVDKPLDYLKALLDIESQYVILNRNGLNKKNKTIFTVHHSKLSWNGKGPLPKGYIDKRISYPFNFMSEKDFFDLISKNYNVICTVEDMSGSFPVNGQDIYGLGAVLKKKC